MSKERPDWDGMPVRADGVLYLVDYDQSDDCVDVPCKDHPGMQCHIKSSYTLYDINNEEGEMLPEDTDLEALKPLILAALKDGVPYCTKCLDEEEKLARAGLI